MSDNKTIEPVSENMQQPNAYISGVDTFLESKEDEIPLDMPFDECIINFFNKFHGKIAHFGNQSFQTNKLDYLLLKRFLFTAYNNLTEMDLSISQGRVKEPYRNLIEVEGIYLNLQKIGKKPIDENYERIFLSQQKSYNLILKDIEYKKNQLSVLDTRVKSLSYEINELKDILSKLSNESKEYLEKEELFKKCNTNYTDSIHNAAILREKLEKVTYYVQRFREVHIREFTAIFQQESAEIKEELLEILNSFSFVFDQILWEEAKESTIIRKFFKNARIQGSYSSKTYLQYFLKNISEDSQNEEHQKLKELYKYLEKNTSKYIYVLGKDISDLAEIKEQIEAIDKDYTVAVATDPERLIVEYTRKSFNLIILEDSIGCGSCFDVIDEFWKKFPESKANIPILLRFNDPTYEEVNSAGKKGIRYFMYKDASEDELTEKIREIL